MNGSAQGHTAALVMLTVAESTVQTHAQLLAAVERVVGTWARKRVAKWPSIGRMQGSMGRSSRRPGIYPDLRAIRQQPCFSRFGGLTGIITITPTLGAFGAPDA